jgi:hypothetical protein
VRIARHAPKEPEKPSLEIEQSKLALRFARNAPTDHPKVENEPTEPPKRFARHVMIQSSEAPKSIRKEIYVNSITTFNREKRATEDQ